LVPRFGGKSTIQNFDSADGNFANLENCRYSAKAVRIEHDDPNFFDLSHRKSGSGHSSDSGILKVRYVARDPDNVADAHSHNGHTNYCLAWALSGSQYLLKTHSLTASGSFVFGVDIPEPVDQLRMGIVF
jgi:hypothetical protein